VPVRLHGAERGVVRVKRRVCRPAELVRDRAAEENRPDAVVLRLRLVLVEREEDERVLVVEARVLEQRVEPELEPRVHERYVRVVPVVDEVRRHEEPLRDRARVDVRGKVVEVADFGGAQGHGCDRVVDYQRVVLAYVERVGSCTGSQVVDRREAVIGLDMLSKQARVILT